jgi:hypothetical protein
MKTMILFICMLCICSLGLTQDLNHNHNLKPGVIFITQTPGGQWIIDGFPPPTASAMSTINEVYLFPLDGSGPIPISDPTLIKRINPYHNFTIDGIDPGPSPLKRKVVNPAFLIPIDGIDPGPSPLKRKVVNPAYLIIHN